MKLVVGIGNPGEKYKNTRHNVGMAVLDRFADEFDSTQWIRAQKFIGYIKKPNSTLTLLHPWTYMNTSGKAVKRVVDFYKLDLNNLYIIHDDLDIRLGLYKIQYEKGPKDHKGIESIESRLGSTKFWRVRVGIDNRDLGSRISGEDYVLQNFDQGEKEIIDKVTKEIIHEIKGVY